MYIVTQVYRNCTFFVKEEQFHVHVFEENNPEIERHLNFRNWLRYHPVDRNAYENLKRELASKFKEDRQGYAFAKSDFVTNIDMLAGWDGIKVVKALSEEEWAYVAKHCINKDLSLSHDEQNCYLTLLHYAEVVGCAHVYMPINNTPSIKQMFIENELSSSIRNTFLKTIKKWLLSKGFENWKPNDL